MKKFYAVIGNPPYQEEVEGNQRKNPIYNYFLDESFRVSQKTELITPARFLFNAGQTPKEWNQKMLSDPHLKVVSFAADAESVFPGIEIKGGVAVTYRDETKTLGPIGTFVPYEELKTIIPKTTPSSTGSLADMFVGAVPYRFTDAVRTEKPELVNEIGSSFDLRTNILDKLNNKLFFQEPTSENSIAVFGLINKKRGCLWIERKYIAVPNNFAKYKVLLPKASGNGTYGERLAELAVASKNVGHTQSFVSIGGFETEDEADALCKYLKTKFVRALLGILKVTQDITARVWEFVPLQDFSDSSDLDWNMTVPEIDQQLYSKYGLSPEEIEFVETHVKEMN